MVCYHPHLRLMPASFKGFFLAGGRSVLTTQGLLHSAVMNGVKTLPNLESGSISLHRFPARLSAGRDQDRRNGVLNQLPHNDRRSFDGSHFI